MNEQPYQRYFQVLYPEYSDPRSTLHWYGKWKTAEMCMGLYSERQQARHAWIAAGHRRGRGYGHQAVVVTHLASPVRSLTAKVCLSCMWVSRDLDQEHP